MLMHFIRKWLKVGTYTDRVWHAGHVLCVKIGMLQSWCGWARWSF